MSGNQKQQQTSHQNQATVKAGKLQQKTIRTINPEQMLSAPETLRSEDVLAAQQQVGNQVVQRALDKKGRDQRVTDSQGNLSEDLTKQIQAKRGGGSPLPDSIQKDASKKLGRKFNDVRIHTDETADKLSRSVSARAFTIGKDIFFKGGVFSPTSSAGRETLIHELTHVVQQSSGSRTSSGGKLKLGAPDTAMEKEAAQMGKKHASQFSTAAPAAGAVQRQEEEEELQMQEDEEEMQMQPDITPAIQREGEEEELQMQEEEEELQMQPDTSAVIQRGLSQLSDEDKEDLNPWKGKVSPGIQARTEALFGKHRKEAAAPAPQTRSRSNAVGSLKDAGDKAPPAPPVQTRARSNAVGSLKDAGDKAPPAPPVQTRARSNAVGSLKDAGDKAPPAPPMQGRARSNAIGSLEHAGDKAPAALKNRRPAPPPPAPPLPTTVGGKKSGDSELQAKVKAMRSNKQRENLAKLEEDRSKKVGERVSEQYKEDQAAKPKSTKQKIGGFFKKVGGGLKKGAGFLASKAKGFIAGQVKDKIKDAKEHYTGKKEEESKEEAKSAGVTVNVNSGAAGGGGGGGGMAATISELYQENKQLKAENAELKKKKEEVPVS